jgi:hypothetical protein
MIINYYHWKKSYFKSKKFINLQKTSYNKKIKKTNVLYFYLIMFKNYKLFLYTFNFIFNIFF